jgi:flagellar basal-body rod protein FlgB
MQVNLFELAAKQSQWLSVRQSAIAGNVANVNTPGYKALQVEPFEKVLDGTRVAIKATQVSHLSGGGAADGVSIKQRENGPSVLPSHNNVVLENELMDAGEVRRAFELNTGIVKAFNRMTLLVSKG